MTARSGRRRSARRRLLQLAAVIATSAGVAYAITAASATAIPHFRVRPLAKVFAVLHDAQRGDAGSAPRDAIGDANSTVIAGTFTTGDSVYVATLESGAICLVDQEPVAPTSVVPNTTVGLTAVACAHAAQAEQTGTGIATPSIDGSDARITLLLPNGVQTVLFATANGTTNTQAVVDNVAQYAAPNLSSATFITPAGQQVSDAVPTTITPN